MTQRVCTMSLPPTNNILNSSKLRGYKYYRLVGFGTEGIGMRENDEVRITPTSLLVVMTLRYLMLFSHGRSGCDK